MEATRIGAANTVTGIPLRLELPQTESNRSNVDWNLLDSLESDLLEPQTEIDLECDPVHDFLLDQDVGSVTLCDSSRPPVHNLAPYKCMPKFGDKEIVLLQPLLPIVENGMDVEDVGPSRIDSPPAPVPAPSSQQGATPSSGIPSTSTSGSGSNPVELQLSASQAYCSMRSPQDRRTTPKYWLCLGPWSPASAGFPKRPTWRSVRRAASGQPYLPAVSEEVFLHTAATSSRPAALC